MLVVEVRVRRELAQEEYLPELAPELCLVALEMAVEEVLEVAQQRVLLGVAQGEVKRVGYEAVEPFDNILEKGNDKHELHHDKLEVVYNMKDQLLHTEEIVDNIYELVCDEMVHTDDMQLCVDMDELHGIQRVVCGWMGKPYGKEEKGE